MPEEIPVKLRPFSGYIYSPRLSVAELIAVLETFEGCSVTATSNDAKFSDLDDIRSAPARFSGHPSVRILKHGTDAEVNVQFASKWIKVESSYDNNFGEKSEQSDALARSVYEELKPFGFAPLKYLRLLTEYTAPLGMSLLFLIVISIFYRTSIENLLSWDFVRMIKMMIWTFIFVVCPLYFAGIWLTKLKSVTYNPRATWWQKHGESALTGIAASILTFIVVTFALK
jgi:hypothetical protein